MSLVSVLKTDQNIYGTTPDLSQKAERSIIIQFDPSPLCISPNMGCSVDLKLPIRILMLDHLMEHTTILLVSFYKNT
jgi:hypothetical protein